MVIVLGPNSISPGCRVVHSWFPSRFFTLQRWGVLSNEGGSSRSGSTGKSVRQKRREVERCIIPAVISSLAARRAEPHSIGKSRRAGHERKVEGMRKLVEGGRQPERDF